MCWDVKKFGISDRRRSVFAADPSDPPGQAEDRLQAFEAGFDNHLVKPADISLLFTLIEKPFRSRRFSVRWLGVAAFATAVLCPVGALVQRQLVAPQDMLVYEAWFDRDVFRCGTSYRMLHPLSLSCQIGDDLEIPAKRVLLVGNSHADSIKSAFSRATRSVNMVEFFIADNGPLMPGGGAVYAVVRTLSVSPATWPGIGTKRRRTGGRAMQGYCMKSREKRELKQAKKDARAAGRDREDGSAAAADAEADADANSA